MIYGKTKTVDKKLFALMFVRVIIQANEPPKIIATIQLKNAIFSVFQKGS